MPILGKYDFPGIRKAGTFLITTALVGTPVGNLLNVWGLGYTLQLFVEWGVVWLANKGLVLLNVGAGTFQGEFDQKRFDNAMEEALMAAEINASKLTPAERNALEEKVKDAFRKFATFDVPKSKSRDDDGLR